MILNNKVSQRLEIIGFKGAVKKSTSRIQVISLSGKGVYFHSETLHKILAKHDYKNSADLQAKNKCSCQNALL